MSYNNLSEDFIKLKVFETVDDNDIEELKKLFEIILSEKQKINVLKKTNSKKQNVLHLSCLKGRTDIIKYIVPYFKKYKISLDKHDNNDYTPLLLAFIIGYKDIDEEYTKIGEYYCSNRFLIVKYLILNGADITLPIYYNDNNPLHWALFHNDYYLSKYLISSHFEFIFYINKNNEFPIDMIFKKNKNNYILVKQSEIILDYLLLNLFKLYITYISENHDKKDMIKNKLSLNEIAPLNPKAKLNMAVNKIRNRAVDNIFIITNKIIKDNKNNTFSKYIQMYNNLMSTINMDNNEIEVIGNRNDVLSKFDNCVFYWAAYTQNIELFNILLFFRKANPFVIYKEKSVFHLICITGNFELLKLLLSKIFYINIGKNKRKYINKIKVINSYSKVLNNTGVIYAATKSNEEIINYLLLNDSDPFKINIRGQTVIDFNISNNLKKICIKKYFELYKAKGYSFEESDYKFIIYYKKKFTSLLESQLILLVEKYGKGLKYITQDCFIHKKRSILAVKIEQELLNELAEEMGLYLYNVKEKIVKLFKKDNYLEYYNFSDDIIFIIIKYLISKEINIDELKDKGIIIDYFIISIDIKLSNIIEEFSFLKFFMVKNDETYNRYILKLYLYYGTNLTIFFIFFEIMSVLYLFIFIIMVAVYVLSFFFEAEIKQLYFYILVVELIVLSILRKNIKRNIERVKYIANIRKNKDNNKYYGKNKSLKYTTYSSISNDIVTINYNKQLYYFYSFSFMVVSIIVSFLVNYFSIKIITNISSTNIINYFISVAVSILFLTFSYLNYRIKLYFNIKVKLEIDLLYSFLLIIIYPINALILYDINNITHIENLLITNYSSNIIIFNIIYYIIPLSKILIKKEKITKRMTKIFTNNINEITDKNYNEIYNKNNLSSINNFKTKFIINNKVNIIMLNNHNTNSKYHLIYLFIFFIYSIMLSPISKIFLLIYFIYLIWFYFVFKNLFVKVSIRNFSNSLILSNAFTIFLNIFLYFYLIFSFIIYNFILKYKISYFYLSSSLDFNEILFILLIGYEVFIILFNLMIDYVLKDIPKEIKNKLIIEKIKHKSAFNKKVAKDSDKIVDNIMRFRGKETESKNISKLGTIISNDVLINQNSNNKDIIKLVLD